MALTAERDTQRKAGEQFEYEVAASTTIYAGALVVINASGYAEPGTTATNKKAVGRCEATADNSSGSAGDINVKVRAGEFQWGNSASADEITEADVGKFAYIVDDETVAKTSSSGTRSIAGVITAVDSDGVWVKMGPGLEGKGLAPVIAGGAAYTVTAADDGALIQTATDNAVITLPLAASNKGLKVTVLNSGADGGALVSIRPNALDAIVGSIANAAADSVSGGVVDKDWANTKATANKGDYTTLVSDGGTSWLIVGGVGIWTSEA